MKKNVVEFIRNLSYTITANLVTLVISLIVVVIVPKLIGVQEYGYWQLFIFYSSYLGFLHFGWNDGIYLKLGGKDYQDVNKSDLFRQFYMLLGLQIIFALIICVISYMYSREGDKTFIIYMNAIYLVIINTRGFLLYILQSTNRIKEYAKISILDRILYCVILLALIFIGRRDYKSLIGADLVGKIVTLVYSIYIFRDIVVRDSHEFFFDFKQSYRYISSGIKLMISNISSMMIIGVVRFGIERVWDIATFGKISLTLSISSLMMVFINAMGIVVFPILRRTDRDKLPIVYTSMRQILMLVMLVLLLIYYPLKSFLNIWLPSYADSVVYMALLFPMSIYEGLAALITNTYFKTLRKENILLRVNMISLSLSIIISYFTSFVFKRLDLAIVSIVVLLAIRSAISEYYISKFIRIDVSTNILVELVLVFGFIVSSWYIKSDYSYLIYLGLIVMYLILFKRKILDSINFFNKLIKP